MLPTPHGGRLVHRRLSASDRTRRESEADELPTVRPVIDALYDAQQIAIGAYSPLEGFQGSADVASILEKNLLDDGQPWSIPIILAPAGKVDEETVNSVKPGDDVGIRDPDGHLTAILHLEEKYRLDRKRFAAGTFGTVDPTHPNVADVFALGDMALAGPIDLVRPLDLPAARFELTPEQSRAAFDRLGWTHVAAYQCRNPPHTAHEYLQRVTLERSDVDGLFVHPVVGRLKKGDYKPDVILRSYEQLVEHYYPKQRVLLASMSITMRYAGPRAALFFAIVRKNYGCSHYIVGRDQAGVGTFYDPYACHRIFDSFDVGVVPLRYEETYFCRTCGWMATPRTCAHPAETRLSTSQTRIRAALAKGEPLPVEIIRPEVAKILSEGDVLLEA